MAIDNESSRHQASFRGRQEGTGRIEAQLGRVKTGKKEEEGGEHEREDLDKKRRGVEGGCGETKRREGVIPHLILWISFISTS